MILKGPFVDRRPNFKPALTSQDTPRRNFFPDYNYTYVLGHFKGRRRSSHPTGFLLTFQLICLFSSHCDRLSFLTMAYALAHISGSVIRLRHSFRHCALLGTICHAFLDGSS